MSKPPEAQIICAQAGIFGATRYGESYKHDPIVDSCHAGNYFGLSTHEKYTKRTALR